MAVSPLEFFLALLIELHDLDAQVPSSYLEQSLRLFDAHNFDEAAVLYYIGLIRHQYYISTNSNYAPNEDWINAESMKAVYGKKFDFVLKTNIEKYILVLKLATEYYEKMTISYLQNKTISKNIIAKLILLKS